MQWICDCCKQGFKAGLLLRSEVTLSSFFFCTACRQKFVILTDPRQQTDLDPQLFGPCTEIKIDEKRHHYHFKRKKDMKRFMQVNWNSHDTFSYAGKAWEGKIPTKELLTQNDHIRDATEMNDFQANT